MDNVTLREQEILRLKEELSIRYNYLMVGILLIYALIFLFIIKDNIMFKYCLIGSVFLCVTAFLYFQKYIYIPILTSISLKRIVRLYLIIAPLYTFFIILYFWKCTVMNFCWLIPIPFGAYIFFGKKEGFIFSAYSVVLSVIILLIATNYTFNFKEIPYEKTRYTDILVIAFNISVIWLFVYYKDKIKEQEFLAVIEKRQQITLPVTLDEEEMADAKSLFEKIENEIITNKHFTNPKFNISILSATLKISNNYISKAIRLQGYSNFNTYINSHKINYVKELIETSDLEKVTLMYIYTEAGFANQSTFNKAFKQFLGMTPSEYMQNMSK